MIVFTRNDNCPSLGGTVHRVHADDDTRAACNVRIKEGKCWRKVELILIDGLENMICENCSRILVQTREKATS